jgi:hypothetical protein
MYFRHNCFIQDYWSSGFCPSSRILKTRKHNVLEPGLRLALSEELNRFGVFLPSPEDAMRTSFRNVVFFIVFRIPYEGQNPEPQEFWVLYTIVRIL